MCGMKQSYDNLELTNNYLLYKKMEITYKTRSLVHNLFKVSAQRKMTFTHLDTNKKTERLFWIAHNKAYTGKDKLAEELGARIGWNG